MALILDFFRTADESLSLMSQLVQPHWWELSIVEIRDKPYLRDGDTREDTDNWIPAHIVMVPDPQGPDISYTELLIRIRIPLTRLVISFP